MDEDRPPTAAELDQRRRDDVARWMRAWLADHERAGAGQPGAGDALARFDARALELVAGLVRLQVCRGRRAGAIAGGLADRLDALGVAYERCASVPDAAERDLDVGRAGTFRALAALLRGRDAMEEPGADPRN